MRESSETLFWVNGRPVSGEALRQLLLIDDDGSLLAKLVEQAIIAAECESRQIEADAKAVSEEMNAIRKTKHLFSSQDTKDWLHENGLSDSQFESIVKARVKHNLLKKEIAEGKVEKYFALEKWRFDAVELYRIRVSKLSTAEELVAQLHDGAQFFGLAKRFSEDKATSASCGYMGKVKRESLRPEIESEIFAAQDGTIVGPLNSIDGFHIYLVEKIEPAKMIESVILEIEDKLFSEWLKEKVDSVEISYNMQTAQ